MSQANSGQQFPAKPKNAFEVDARIVIRMHIDLAGVLSEAIFEYNNLKRDVDSCFIPNKALVALAHQLDNIAPPEDVQE